MDTVTPVILYGGNSPQGDYFSGIKVSKAPFLLKYALYVSLTSTSTLAHGESSDILISVTW